MSDFSRENIFKVYFHNVWQFLSNKIHLAKMAQINSTRFHPSTYVNKYPKKQSLYEKNHNKIIKSFNKESSKDLGESKF
jgi:hypothetical protein